ncbi:MAG: FlgD immunoglobulin-like domain containing protein [Candidatus Krumholzibacteriota bacterium]
MLSRFLARSLFLLLSITLVSFVQAGEIPRFTLGGESIHGGSADLAKAGGDTINLMAARHDPTNGPGEPFYYGDFEDADGNPAWNGWTHWDVTQPTETHWNVSNFNQPDPANHAAWCGDISIAACDTGDAVGGYGNSWHDMIEFRHTVPYPGANSTVTVTATLINDTEPTYDYTYLSYRYHGQVIADLQSWDGTGTFAVNGLVTYQPLEYLDGTDIAVYFRFKSDGGWSDEDCSFPSAGACQVDDINVHLVNDVFTGDFFEDFEHGGVPDDFGIWNIAFPDGVGDFSKIWVGLHDIDPCIENSTPQVAFIDDGLVVPGTGGSECINWCYGPGGYIVNTTGGLAGPYEHIHNVIESPVMDWPAPKSGTGPDDDGIIFTAGIYRHEDLTSDAPGSFYNWGVRSADTDNSAGHGIQDITEQGWQDRTSVYYGGPDYIRAGDDVTDLMNQGRDQVQVQLGVYELGWIWYWTGNDGYPAPYFDNVTVKIYPFAGPGFHARELDMAQDNFPARGSIDYGDLGSHSVRFDAANNISLAAHLCNCPGDSMVVDISPVRTGAAFDGDPVMHYTVDRNPVFDPFRGPTPAVGTSTGKPAVGVSGSATPGKWAFDLPDTGFLFPGDVLHYYITATDAIGGVGGTDPQTSTLPADLTGYGVFGDPMGYNSSFVIHALPSIKADNSHPPILFINDFANRGGENEWYTALNNIGKVPGEDYDIYYVNGPSSGAGNGIGGRANSILIAGYDEILYTCGDLGVNTISNGDFNNDAGDDVGTLTSWLDSGGKDIFLTGDELASDLMQAGAATIALAENYLGVSVLTNDIRPLIDNQVTLLISSIGGNTVFTTVDSWVAYGGCASLNTFDATEVRAGTERLAEFLDPTGAIGAYPFSAASLNATAGTAGTSRVVSLPYDLMYLYTDPGSPGDPLPARARVLRDVLLYFGVAGDPGEVTPALPVAAFKTSHYPNPFNPSTTIKYSMPTAGHLKLNIYNVRGQLVKTLIDGPRPAGADQTIVWDGSDNLGSSVSSGVYFYEARVGSEVKIGKMTLLK